MNDSTRPRYRIVTVIAPPFVMYNKSSNTFYGYCIDLLNDIQLLMDFDYDIRESFDKEYGYIGRTHENWNGMISELMNNQSDIAVGSIWINSARSRVVDFTIPVYRSTGFTVMMLKHRRNIPFLRFLNILEPQVWLGFAMAFLLTTFLLFIFERYSPFSHWNNSQKCRNETDSRFSSLKECFWFTFASLTPEGCGGTPKNFSGKIAAATWWLFIFVIVAAYTANLAAYETLVRLEKHVESLDDLTKQYQMQYTTVNNSAAYRHFCNMFYVEDILYKAWMEMVMDESTPAWERSQHVVWEYPLADKYTRMMHSMVDIGFFSSLEEAVEKVQGKDAAYEYALIEDASTIRYLMLNNCDFRQVGDEFAKAPSAFAVQRGSALRKRINEALTTLTIQRKLEDLERKWWDENPLKVNCPAEKEFNAGFGLENLGIVFLLIIIGIIISALILCFQYFLYYYLPKEKSKNDHRFKRNVQVSNRKVEINETFKFDETTKQNQSPSPF